MKRQAGFTLIELMIVVAVVGILAAIAYPAYQDYIRKARRSDAMNALAEIRIEQEKWRANNTSFTTDLSSAALGVGTTSPDGYYNLSIPSAGATSYLATATPTGDQAGDDCGTFAVERDPATDQDGPQYTGYADQSCWSR